MSDDHKPKTPEELAASAIEWLSSEEGAAQLKAMFKLLEIQNEERRKARRVSWIQMNTPMTI